MTRTSRSRFGAGQGIMVDSLNARNCDHQRLHNQDVGNCKGDVPISVEIRGAGVAG